MLQARVDVTADRVHVLRTRERPTVPRSRARIERMKLLGFRSLTERPPHRPPNELRTRCAGGPRNSVEELELLAAEVDLRPSYGVTIHHYAP